MDLQTRLLKVDKTEKDLLLPIHKEVSGIYKWIPGDTEEAWKHNLKNNKHKLDELGWTENSISYVTDSLGFRNNTDFITGETYSLFLGCSHTFGIGLPKDQIWTHHVEQAIGSNCYNAAVPGGSLDACYRILYILQKRIQIKNVFIFLPSMLRKEIFHPTEKFWDTISPWTNTYLFRWIGTEQNLLVNYNKTIDAIENICNKNDIKLFTIDSESFESDNCARDLSHSGPSVHKKIADKFMELYNE